MIRDLQVIAGNAPAVSWVEDRGKHSPQAGRRVRVECQIMRKDDRGELLFVARGSVRFGQFEEGLSWRELVSFREEPAEARFYSDAERARRKYLAGKSKAAEWMLHDGARVIVADFKGGHSLNVNDAEAAPVEIARVLATLRDEFIEKRAAYFAEKCDGLPVWPRGKAGAPDIFKPAPAPKMTTAGMVREAVEWVVVICSTLGAIVAALWFSGLVRF